MGESSLLLGSTTIAPPRPDLYLPIYLPSVALRLSGDSIAYYKEPDAFSYESSRILTSLVDIDCFGAGSRKGVGRMAA